MMLGRSDCVLARQGNKTMETTKPTKHNLALVKLIGCINSHLLLGGDKRTLDKQCSSVLAILIISASHSSQAHLGQNLSLGLPMVSKKEKKHFLKLKNVVWMLESNVPVHSL